MALTWKDELENQLAKKFGSKGKALSEKYSRAFHTSYQEENTAKAAANDIEILEKLSPENTLEIQLFQSGDVLHLRFYQYSQPIPLSDILPMLENMDLRTLEERPFDVTLSHSTLWISDFSVIYAKNSPLDIAAIEDIFKDALLQIYFGRCENDGFNKLVLGSQIPWREVMILRAYAKYLHQTRYRFSQNYIEKTLATYPEITKDLILFFIAKFDPKNTATEKNLLSMEEKILQSLEKVTSLDDDRTLRRLFNLMKATLRTNYFQKNSAKQHKEYLSFKLNSKDVPELPLPHPLYEIFVYSPRFEGIHLRSAKVARGGIRWSDRREDFRTEILGLMKAQKVKNAVIVPSGAKGGFVLKALPLQATRDVIQKEVIFCYKSFISGLLDLTDNYAKNGSVTRPPQVVCYDDEDPYLVVAADKGTATFSDIANGLSKDYGFWLGDAFASGGSAGYDHKKMGITARGAWESIKRHFRELDVDVTKTEITMVGIGDMSGDVFGNGALYTKHLKLVAAFDHRNIFLDPNPHPEKSFKERERLFNLPTSSWEDYDSKLISTGGGVYKRSLKSIPISSQMKKILAIEDNALTPNELIRALLKAPVDLLFNGGIGTYVKAMSESHDQVGDKTNEFCRVNGNELRCKVVGEGGNLGFTQLGRIEYALQGGLINTDFIDNSAGVDCSDHEVNIKILLNEPMVQGKLSEKQRNEMLVKMTQDVARLVLYDNYNQALVMSFAALVNSKDPTSAAYIRELEETGELNRHVEFLPDDKIILDRKAAGIGLTRPEIAVLLAYTKIHIKNEILKSDLPENTYLEHMIENEFPNLLHKNYYNLMLKHRLRREIIATQLSNLVVNEMGIMFVHRVQTETGASVADIVRAEIVSSHIFRAAELQKVIESLDFKVSVKLQYELLQHLRRLLTLSTRWFLYNNRLKGDMADIIKLYRDKVDILAQEVPKLMLGHTKTYLEKLSEDFIHMGIQRETAQKIAATRALYTTLNVIEVSTAQNLDLLQTAKIYFNVGGRFNLVWFRDHITNDTREGHWNTLARLTIRDELDVLQKNITHSIMRNEKKITDPVQSTEKWVQKNRRAMDRWEKVLEMLHGSTNIEYSMFFIAIREFSGLIV
jgi:glutamate dehydrogenase